jgi:hypothetical protein
MMEVMVTLWFGQLYDKPRMVGRKADVQEAEEEDDQERDLGALRNPQGGEDPQRQPQDQEVGHDVESGRRDPQDPAVDTAATSDGGVPVELDR